jgi:hypothetical protein
MQSRAGSLASLTKKNIKQLSKGTQVIADSMVLMQEEMSRLRNAIEAFT